MTLEIETPTTSEVLNNANFDIVQTRLAESFPDLIEESSGGWQNLINKTSSVDMPAGLDIMTPTSPCNQFMLILEGRVRVFQHTDDDREVTLYRLRPGDLCVLSINALLRCKSYGAHARSETGLKALVFTKEQFFEAMAISEIFRNYVLTSVSDRFNDLLKLMETTVFESLDTRLICLLGKMSRTSNTNSIHITHHELARELGTSREVISRVLKGLERKGCLNLSRGVIQIKM